MITKNFISFITIVKIILLFLIVYATVYNIKKEFFSGITKTIPKTVSLSEIDFPCVLRFQINGLIKNTVLKKSYPNSFKYFVGDFSNNSKKIFDESGKLIKIRHENGYKGWTDLRNPVSAKGEI